MAERRRWLTRPPHKGFVVGSSPTFATRIVKRIKEFVSPPSELDRVSEELIDLLASEIRVEIDREIIQRMTITKKFL